MKQIDLIKNKEYFYILGVLLGDGNILSNRIRIAVKDKDFIIECKNSLENCLNSKIIIKKIKNNGFKKSYLYYVNFNSIILSQIIQKDINNLKNLKDKAKIISFLEGIYDSEGCVSKDRKRIRLIMRDFSKNIIDLISLYLNYLKINYKIRKFDSKKKEWFIIDINGKEIIKFGKLINFSIEKKQQRLKEHLKNYKINWLNESLKREETLILNEKDWCKKYNLTRNQYFRNKRKLQ